jgi:hypothetical protein
VRAGSNLSFAIGDASRQRLGFDQRENPSWGHLGFQRLQPFLGFARSWRRQKARTPNGEIDNAAS